MTHAQHRLTEPLSALNGANTLPGSASEQWQVQSQTQPPLWQHDAASGTMASPNALGGSATSSAYEFGHAFEPFKLYTTRLATAAQRALLNTPMDTSDATVVVMVLLTMAQRQPHVLAPYPGLSDLLLSCASSTPDMTTFLTQSRIMREFCAASNRADVSHLLRGTCLRSHTHDCRLRACEPIAHMHLLRLLRSLQTAIW